MDNVAFIQFYYKSIDPFTQRPMTALQNGFHHVWDYANPIWVELKLTKEEDGVSLKIMWPEELPKTVYLSIWTARQMHEVLVFAKKHSHIKFIVGGPCIWPNTKPMHIRLPKNIELKYGLAEDIFDLAVDLKRWKLVPPSTEFRLKYSYRIGSQCYWGKCVFCNYSDADKRGYDFEPLFSAPSGVVRLVTPSLAPNEIKLLSELDYNDKIYHFYLKGGEDEYQALFKEFPLIEKRGRRLTPIIGVEFPSDRMLGFMNKGISIVSLVKTIKLLIAARCRVELLFIAGWPNLTEEDLVEADKFFDEIRYEHMRAKYSNLIIHAHLDFIERGDPIRSPFQNWGYYPKISPEQRVLADRWLDILHKNGAMSFNWKTSVESLLGTGHVNG